MKIFTNKYEYEKYIEAETLWIEENLPSSNMQERAIEHLIRTTLLEPKPL